MLAIHLAAGFCKPPQMLELTWSIDLIITLLFTDGSITLLQPSRIQETNSHVFLHFTGRNFLSSDRGNKILIWSWGRW